ncbi:aminotransferase class V-fold PLP-dependent enzyme [Rhodobacter sphaeroides]|uniref:NifS-related protein n=1 Tax=Cereibacter sphaeroides (strain ATCC 17023 / DSM 158 / JCM 6121 / CCUG 31486 / LMG 2827 / NBRC 12203 / NCIMB 8253 / ATH 2.4.1.) TaxID=272943 RepID=Q3J4I9_CERS4|nr:aminotransferase class V-fold PLP-dependent enzyme [Cereibacter sphaeroides]ABA78295.1 NifS-related protein [Cereibacter sphaeroides 2.4.1]AMJ46651.1 nitrogen fixation protein NifS [Cereibacter sphaeroides]ANS33364.1 nitrogen fixation protein NifS [Cereibacter sphaeroides]ATN62407.1 nitrogen fixation protein NifS [Cereibacter sphaeroides]AXC60515.1 aminotransferase class V-fold PLP-dependent enzyme [Cereibacter sphaeroides 2.4.1]
MTLLDIGYVRSFFPAFSEPALAGQAFFENAGGSYTCRPVIDRLSRFYHQRKVQPYAPYAASHAAGAEMDEARSRLAALMGVEEDELSFGPSTSANTYVLAQAVRGWLSREGGAIVVTNQDHEANSGVWRRLAHEGIEVREWRIDPETGHLDPAGLPPLLADGRVRLVCFPHCSNVVGEINPVAEICATARAAGAFTCVDGVSYAPHGLPDMEALGADIYLFSAYKTYGPHQGILLMRRALAELLPAQGHWFNADTLFKRFTPAGPDHAQVAACAGLADYVDALAAHHGAGGAAPLERSRAVHRLMREHEIRLLRPLLDQLAARNDLRLIGPRTPETRAPTVALVLDRPVAPVAAALAAHGIMASAGDFYAVRPLEALGIDPARGVLRLSFVHYTSEAEVAQLMLALDAVLGR